MITMITREIAKIKLPKRLPESHKGTYGKVAVVCGSEEMPGAARMVIRAAYKAGAGLVRAYAGESFAPYLKNDIPEAIVKIVSESVFNSFPEKLFEEIGKDLEEYNVVVFGCGVGQNQELEKVLEDLVVNNRTNLILDADGLNLLAKNLDILKQNTGRIIITPHPMEMSRLTGISVADILQDKKKIVLDFAREHEVLVLLKGRETVIADEFERVFINNTGNSSLAKAGTGDVLTGFIAGFLAQNNQPLESMITAAYLHGKAGEIASKSLTEYSVRASDVIDNLPNAIKELKGDV